MKYHYFASPRLIAFVLIAPLAILLIPLFLFLFFGNFSALISVLLLYFPLVFVMGIILRNAFCICTIDAEGISNKYYKLRWEEISEISIERILIFEYSLIPTIHLPSAICFGATKGKRSFVSLNPKQCVFLCFSGERLQILQSLGKGKSTALDAFLKDYSESIESEKS